MSVPVSDTEQLALIADDLTVNRWLCPTCRGNRRMLRILYLDEIVEDGPLTTVCPCRTCGASGWLDYDPEDRSVFPY